MSTRACPRASSTSCPTPARRLLAALAPLLDWGKLHQAEIADARERFDRLQLWRAESRELQAHSQQRQPRVPGVY